MKVTNTERIYCIEVTQRQLQKILDRDDAVIMSIVRNPSFETRYPGTLYKRISSIKNVRSVEYDPMFGAAVHVRVEEPFEATLEIVKKEIAKYVR